MSKGSQIIIAILMSAIVLVSALSMLRTINGAPVGDTSTGSGTSSAVTPPTVANAADVAPRPPCPSAPVGDLDCLGAEGAPVPAKDVIVINVWASWCAPCRQELPMLEEFARSHPEYTVVGVSRDRTPSAPAALLNELGVELPTYWDPAGEFATARGLPPVLPVTLVFRGDQEIARYPKIFTSGADLSAAIAKALQ